MNEQERMIYIMGESKDTKRLVSDLQAAADALGMTDYLEGMEHLKNEALKLQEKINKFLKKVK